MSKTKKILIVLISLVIFATVVVDILYKKDHTPQYTPESIMSDDDAMMGFDEKTNEDGTCEITLTYSDGSTRTIKITNDGSGKGSGVSTDDGDIGSKKKKGKKDSGSGSGSKVEPGDLPGDGKTAFEKFASMSANQQYAFVQAFDDPQDFLDWYHAARAEYEKANPSIEIHDGDIINF